MFTLREKTINPHVVTLATQKIGSEVSYTTKEKRGVFYRVIPSNAREVFYIANLETGVDSFAPSEGDGVYIAERCMPK